MYRFAFLATKISTIEYWSQKKISREGDTWTKPNRIKKGLTGIKRREKTILQRASCNYNGTESWKQGRAKLKLSYLGWVENSEIGQVLNVQTLNMPYRLRSLGFYADSPREPLKVLIMRRAQSHLHFRKKKKKTLECNVEDRLQWDRHKGLN